MMAAKEIVECANQTCHQASDFEGPHLDFHESAVSVAYEIAVSQPNVRFADRRNLLLTKVRLGRNRGGFSEMNSPCVTGIVNVTNCRRYYAPSNNLGLSRNRFPVDLPRLSALPQFFVWQGEC